MELRTYLDETDERIVDLASRAGVATASVYRALHGQPLSVRVAQAISDATGGRVDREALLWGARRSA